MGARWLITGAQGFVGRYVAAHIFACEPDACILGIGRSARLDGYFSHTISAPEGRTRAPLPDTLGEFPNRQYRYQTAAVQDVPAMRSIIEEFRPHFVLHLASGLRGDGCDELRETNVIGTAKLLESIALSRSERPKVVIGSSGGVYGGVRPDRLPLKESEACAPADPYCMSKLAAEHSAQAVADEHGIPLVIARIFNVIGAGQDERHVAGQIAAQLTAIKRGRSDHLKLGLLHCTRDFIDVRDVVRALVTVARNGEGIFNIGTGVERSIAQVAEEFFEIAKLRPPIDTQKEINAGVTRNYADTLRLCQSGFRPAFEFVSSVADLLDYYDGVWKR